MTNTSTTAQCGSEIVGEIVERLKAADIGWSGDACCVSAEVAAEGANVIAKIQSELAAARKALEELRAFAESFHITVMDNFYKDVSLTLHLPHSLSIRLRNDSSKSWIFADLEARRRAALSSKEPEGK